METSKFTTQRDDTQLETIDIAVKPQSINRREFMKLPLEERRRILAEQAEQMLLHYQQDKEWQELETGDLLDY
jgi:acyl-CoA reductase-like NAD-dependent aldehyde dehydrogenase